MKTEDSKKSLLEQYTELTKNSLVRIQYSCGGNSTGINDEIEFVPNVPEEDHEISNFSYRSANEEDVEAMLELLKSNNLPISDLSSGNRNFIVAHSNNKIIGCVAVETYDDSGLLRSLAVDVEYRNKGIGQKLVNEAETWGCNNGLKNLYLLTTTASEFFPKIGWKITDRNMVPNPIAQSTEFASICPSTAICMIKELEL